jgi:hypothetical protein
MSLVMRFHLAVLTLLFSGPCVAAPGVVPVTKAGNWSGNYLFTLTNAVPPSADGESLCLTVTQSGGILGNAVSGTWTTPSLPQPGQFTQQGQRLIFVYADTHQSIFVEIPITGGAITSGLLVLGAPTTAGGVSETANLTIAAGGC